VVDPVLNRRIQAASAPLVAILTIAGLVSDPAGRAQPLGSTAVEPSTPASKPVGLPPAAAGSLAWELVPAPLTPTSLPPPSPLVAQQSGLLWELVPDDQPFERPALAGTPSIPTGTAIPAQHLARSLLRWTLVPPDEVIDPTFAVAEGYVRPDPPPLPETPPPAWPRVRGLARSITVNGNPYPDVGLYVPNGFAADPEFTASATFDWVSRTRSCRTPPGGNWTDCADAVAYLDITPFKGEYASLGFQYAVQSLSGRNNGTSIFAGQSIGFRTAINLTPTTGLAFGGEHIIQLDNTTDLGRNFYLVLSQAIPLSKGNEPVLLVATAGIGSDFYGYGGNGTLGSTDCLSGNNISSPNYPSGRDCFWGPIGSLSLSLGSRVSMGFEWFGYGIGAGISVRPLGDLPLTFSFYATDFLGNTPEYISDLCTDNPCRTRIYGRVTMSF
jgi:hypothetical protein